MERVEVDVFSNAINMPVLRFPGRTFPGSLIQGDSLSILVQLARSIQKRAQAISDEALKDETSELLGLLEMRISVYEDALKNHAISLPYAK